MFLDENQNSSQAANATITTFISPYHRAVSSSPHLIFYAFATCLTFLGYFTIQWLKVRISRRRLTTLHHCKPPRTLSVADWLSESEFKRFNDFRKHTYLKGTLARYDKFGRTFKASMLDATLFNTIEPQNLKTVLSERSEDYSIGKRRKRAFQPLLEDGIFNSDGPVWAHSRKLIRPSLAVSREAQLEVFAKHVDSLIESICTAGPTVDLQQLFFELTLDTATEILFGASSCLLTKQSGESEASAFADAFATVQSTIVAHMCLGKLADVIPEPAHKRHLRYLQAFVDKIIKDHRKSIKCSKATSGSRHILQILDSEIRSPIKLRGQLMSLLVGGRDTTASLLSNLWHVLARRPDVWEKLQTEVAQLHGAKPDHLTLGDLKYLRWCINESLRLHPPVPTNNRQAIRDTVLPLGGGPDGSSPILIPSGSIVGWHCFAMHRREDIFGMDASEFRPERWETLRPGWAYLPFNGGPRTCLGQKLALTEAIYTTARLVQTFDKVVPQSSEPWRESLTLTCASEDGVKVSLYRRGSS